MVTRYKIAGNTADWQQCNENRSA